MPHVSSSGGEDLASSDEVKVYKDEGEEEKPSSESALSEDKLGLVTESEEGKSSEERGGSYTRNEKGPGGIDGKTSDLPDRLPLGFPLIPPYPYPNGATVPGALGHPGLTSLYSMYQNDRFSSPPPAHMGIPPVHIDPKTDMGPHSPHGHPDVWRDVLKSYMYPKGLPRPPMYPLPGHGQFHPLYPELSQVQWSGPGGYPINTSAFRGPYPPLSTSPLSRFSPPGIMPHPGLPPGFHHPAIITPGPRQDIGRDGNDHRQQSLDPHDLHEENNKKKVPKIKKPLNAFMLFMKEMRAQVIEECALKESAAINQILGRRWHALDRTEQAKYYEKARKEKERHAQLYPGWSARDNYASHSKNKKKRKPESSHFINQECTDAKKCRARFGLDQQNSWCKPCRRKKRCIRFLEEGGVYSGPEDSEDPIGSVPTADSTTTDGESMQGSPMPSSTDENRNHHLNTNGDFKPSAGEFSRKSASSPYPNDDDFKPSDFGVKPPTSLHPHRVESFIPGLGRSDSPRKENFMPGFPGRSSSTDSPSKSGGGGSHPGLVSSMVLAT